MLEFARAACGDEVFRQLVPARIIEPTSKQDSLRVLAEVVVDTVSYPTLPAPARLGGQGLRRTAVGTIEGHPVTLAPGPRPGPARTLG